MLSPIKIVLIVSSTISPMDTNVSYKLPNDYSYEANKIMMQKMDKPDFLSDILYKQIHKEHTDQTDKVLE